jgi:hypothetical protein
VMEASRWISHLNGYKSGCLCRLHTVNAFLVLSFVSTEDCLQSYHYCQNGYSSSVARIAWPKKIGFSNCKITSLSTASTIPLNYLWQSSKRLHLNRVLQKVVRGCPKLKTFASREKADRPRIRSAWPWRITWWSSTSWLKVCFSTHRKTVKCDLLK